MACCDPALAERNHHPAARGARGARQPPAPAGEMKRGAARLMLPLMRPQRIARVGAGAIWFLPLFSLATKRAQRDLTDGGEAGDLTSLRDPPRSPVPQEAGVFCFSLTPYGRMPRN